MMEGILVASSSQGRFAIDDSTYGPELTSGMIIEVLLAGQWIVGRVEFHRKHNGYYFIAAKDESICGLCAGMRVRTMGGWSIYIG